MLISKGALSALQSPRTPSVSLTLPPTEKEKDAQALNRVAQSVGQAFAQESLRRKRWEDTRYVTSSGLAQTRLNYELNRELGRFFPLDGRETLPAEGYSKDLSFGVKLEYSDFRDDQGRVRPYPEIVDNVNDRFFKTHSEKAPSGDALSRFDLKFREGRMKAGMASREYDAKRQVGRVSQGLNAVVRAFRENVSYTRGFSPEVFGESVDSLVALRDGAIHSEYADPVGANMAFQVALQDMLAAGVTEAHTDKDNAMALQVLAHTPLRNTHAVKMAMAGVNGQDKRYLKNIQIGKNPFKAGDKLPKDLRAYIPWALAQVDDDQLANIQERALKSFASQTRMARTELNARIKGLLSTATIGSGASRDSGVREAVKKSINKVMVDIQKFYPAQYFPAENRAGMAQAIVANELLDARDFLDGTHSAQLDAALATHHQNLMANIAKRYPQQMTAVLPLAATAMAEMQKSVQREKVLRKNAPNQVLQRSNKAIKLLEHRLNTSDFATPQEKALIQNSLKNEVLGQSARMGVVPSFLTTSDLGLLKSMNDKGYAPGFQIGVRQIREKYGEDVYFDYIVPELTSLDGFTGVNKLAFLMRSPPMGEELATAMVKQSDNAKLVKDLGFDPDFGGMGVMTDDRPTLHRWTDWMGVAFTDKTANAWKFNHLRGYVRDVADIKGATQMETAIPEAARALALHYLATGRASSSGDAVGLAANTLTSGIGSPIEFGGRRTVIPRPIGLNEIQMDHLEDILREESFIRDVILPRVAVTPDIANFAQQTDRTVPEFFQDMFQDEDSTEWRFSETGLYPVIPAEHNRSGKAIVVDGVDMKPVILPYEDLPNYIVRY